MYFLESLAKYLLQKALRLYSQISDYVMIFCEKRSYLVEKHT